MKFQYVSDLHREFSEHKVDQLADCLLLAGDIGVGCDEEWITEHCERFEHVVMVAGNHEFYHQNMGKTIEDFINLEIKVKNFHFLNNDLIELEGIKIAGTTMWSPMYSSKNKLLIEQGLMDFKLIRVGKCFGYKKGVKFSSHLAEFYFKEAKRFLIENPADIVITHHAPHYNSTAERFKDSPYNDAFYADMSEILDREQIWVHGHMHNSSDYKVGNTHILCNPRGYVDDRGYIPHEESNPQYNALNYFEVNK